MMKLKANFLILGVLGFGTLLLAACAEPEIPNPAARPTEAVDLAALYEDGEIPEIPSEAYKLFAENCTACHGPVGDGTSIAPPLNSAELRERLDDTEIFDTIKNGRPGTAMPIWGNQLTDEDISALVALIRNWEKLDETRLDAIAQQAEDCGGGMGMGMRRHMGPMMGEGCGEMHGPWWFFGR